MHPKVPKPNEMKNNQNENLKWALKSSLSYSLYKAWLISAHGYTTSSMTSVNSMRLLRQQICSVQRIRSPLTLGSKWQVFETMGRRFLVKELLVCPIGSALAPRLALTNCSCSYPMRGICMVPGVLHSVLKATAMGQNIHKHYQ